MVTDWGQAALEDVGTASVDMPAMVQAARRRRNHRHAKPSERAGGYQAAAEQRWAHDGGAIISAIFRDTTLQAFEGCLLGPATGWCGLHGQLLVRIGPPDGDADPCSLALRQGPRVARAVDHEGEILDMLVQRRRDTQTALRLMHKLLKKQGFAPKLLVTDKLGSYGSAFRRDITHPNTWVFAFHIQLTL
jgi:hypothetical protein